MSQVLVGAQQDETDTGVGHQERPIRHDLCVIPTAGLAEIQDSDVAVVFVLGRAHLGINMAEVPALVIADVLG